VLEAGRKFRGVRIENLHPRAEISDLQDFFKAQGIFPEKIEIILNPITGVSKGAAFASFGNHENAVCALALSRKFLLGRPLLIFADDSLNTFK